MVKIVFVCLGNICRSPMAECIMADKIKKRGLQDKICVSSRATSDEEEGNSIYPSAQRILIKMGVPVINRRAIKLSKRDGDENDYLIAMETRNLVSMRRIVGDENMNKAKRLLDFCDNPKDIADPWWTGNFELTYDEINKGCECLLKHIEKSL